MDIVNIPSYDTVGIVGKIFSWISDLIPLIPGIIHVFLSYMVVISLPVSLLLILGIFISSQRLSQIRKKEKEIYTPKVEMAFDETTKGDPTLTFRWKKITEHMESENQNDWKQAILEADIILAEILEKMGYQGDGIGEMLRRVERADFHTLDQAWEAHKIRNIIAHEGASYELTQYEAKRVINLYKQVFEEFFYI